MEYFSVGSPDMVVNKTQADALVTDMVEKMGSLDRVLLVPPDFTRYHSGAGELTVMLYEKLQSGSHVEILPALGTHVPVSSKEKSIMFPGIPPEAFKNHHWRNEVVDLGMIPSSLLMDVSEGKLDYEITCRLNKLLVNGNWDKIISIGQLVPHEVIGIANEKKKHIYRGWRQ